MNIKLEVEADQVSRLKKRYFAMVNQLGREYGYLAYKERELFKQQVQEQIGGPTISEIETAEDMFVRIEELHLLAITHYEGFRFEPDDAEPITISFHIEPDIPGE